MLKTLTNPFQMQEYFGVTVALCVHRVSTVIIIIIIAIIIATLIVSLTFVANTLAKAVVFEDRWVRASPPAADSSRNGVTAATGNNDYNDDADDDDDDDDADKVDGKTIMIVMLVVMELITLMMMA